jgi:ATP-dependent DNA helicase RecG
MQISDRIDSVKGIGDKTRALFEKLNVNTVGQLLTYYPRDYETFSGPVPIASLREGMIGVVEASVSRISETRTGSRMNIISCVATDPSGGIVLTWFNQPYLKKQLSMGYRYIFRGKITRKGTQLRMEQPKFYKREEYARLQNVLQPVYPLTKGLTNNMVSKSMKQALGLAGELPEPLRLKSFYVQENFDQFHAVVSNTRETRLSWDEKRMEQYFSKLTMKDCLIFH